MSMKSGYISAKKQGSDGRWVVRFDRVNPKEGQSKSWYVKLRDGDPEPIVSETQITKFDASLLKELDQLGGCDYYEHIFAETFKSDQTYIPTDPQSDVTKTIPETLETDLDTIRPYLSLTKMALHLCCETGMLEGEKDELAQNGIIVGAMCTLVSAAKKFQKIVENENLTNK